MLYFGVIMKLSHRYFKIPVMHEDELPNDISKELYIWWFDNSFLDIVKMGPKIYPIKGNTRKIGEGHITNHWS
jgi:hypothetical protein